jgi:glycosyltransferase involved in cell wall biosynthesis
MNVLFVMHNLRRAGGLGRSTAELLPALRAIGVDASIACLWGTREEMDLSGELRDRGVPVTVLPHRDVGRKVRPLRKLIKELEPAVVHTARSLPSTIGRLASIGLPVTVVTSIISAPEHLGHPKHAVAYRRTIRLTDHFHAVSQAVKDYAIRELRIPGSKITVIERGRDLARLGAPSPERRRLARAALGIPDDAPVILNVGRQDAQKDQVTLLAAFEHVAVANPDALLLIAGPEGAATPDVLAQHKLLSHPERAQILGQRDDVPELLAAADVFAFPSLWEGFSGSVLEAMALGLPVVAGDIPPLREAVQEGVTGTFVPVGQPQDLAAALTALLNHPEHGHALGAAGRSAFMKLHTVERSAERMRDLYAELLQPRNKAMAA